jgi:hypothetical protein
MTMPKAVDQTTTIQRVEPPPVLPRYTELDSAGTLFFIVGDGRRIQMPDDPRTPEFKAAYCAALALAIAAEPDIDDWSELKVLYAAQAAQRVAKLRRIAIKGIAAMLVKDRCAYGGDR